jgi:glycosyltransferase involved in cell wall biosynthesis
MITVVITAYNEEHHIQQCIVNARKLTKDVIVVDTESTDATPQLAREMSVPVYSHPYTRYVEPSRNFAISHVKTEWLFILDADERFSDELISEIRETLASTNKTHFEITKKNIFAGIWWLQHGGWNADTMIRCIKKDAFVNWPADIHSTPEIKGEKGHFNALLEHHFHPSLENMVEKTALYEDMESNLLQKAGRKASVPIFFRKFLGELYRRLIKHQGYKDGIPGVIESVYQAYSKTITYLYVYEKSSIV